MLFAGNPLSVWSNIEFASSIIATSAATLRPLIEKMGKKLCFSFQLSGTGNSVAASNIQPHLRSSQATAVSLDPDYEYELSTVTKVYSLELEHKRSDVESGERGGGHESRERLPTGKSIESENLSLPSLPENCKQIA
jgi:hypothetical protein